MWYAMGMRTALLLPVLVLPLCACWNITTTGHDGGVEGVSDSGAGGQASTCIPCGRVLLDGDASTSLCNASADLFEQLQTCACDQGPCGTDCYNSLCMGGAADEGCKTCLEGQCAGNFANCSNDAATH